MDHFNIFTKFKLGHVCKNIIIRIQKIKLGVSAALPVANTALAAKDRRFVDQAAAFQRQFRQQDQQQALLSSTNSRFTEQLQQASNVNSSRFNENQDTTEQEKLTEKVDMAHSVDSGNILSS